MSPQTILIVDDDPLQRKLLGVHLSRLGFDVVAAQDGEDGLEQAHRIPPDAIVSDVLMPRMDGFRLCMEVRREPRLAAIPIVLTSVEFIEEADRRLAEKVGANGFVLRTPDFGDVIDAVLNSIGKGVPPARSHRGQPVAEYAQRLAQQLERQAERRNQLAQRLAWLESKLTMLARLAEAVRHTATAEPVVDEMLHKALEAIGCSVGLAYLLRPGGSFSLRTDLGCSDIARPRLPDFFGHAELLHGALEIGEPSEMPSTRFPDAFGILSLTSASRLVVAPLVSGDERLGVLVMAWANGDEREELLLATAVASQVSQAIALARALWRLRASEERLAILARAGSVLAESLDYDATIENVALLAVPAFADWCALDVVSEDGSIRWLAGSCPTPSDGEWSSTLSRALSREPESPCGPAQVISTATAEFYPDVPVALEDLRGTPMEPIIQPFHDTGLVSLAILPLVAQDRVLGAITFGASNTRGCYTQEDFTLAEELARRGAAAIHSAELYRQAQDALNVRNEFLSIAAHELKTPITSLVGFSQLAVRHLDNGEAGDSRVLRRSLQVIDQQSAKLARLVSQLLEISRVESGRLNLSREMVDLAGLVGEVVEVMSATTDRHRLVVHTASAQVAWIDPLRVEQVVTNLLDNAIKYSPEGGDIDVELDSGPAEVRLSVRDKGVGIPSDQLDKIFDPFFQVHPGLFSGMGLGLFISRRIVELHGGTMSAESPSGGGTRFTVTLPRHSGTTS